MSFVVLLFLACSFILFSLGCWLPPWSWNDKEKNESLTFVLKQNKTDNLLRTGGPAVLPGSCCFGKKNPFQPPVIIWKWESNYTEEKFIQDYSVNLWTEDKLLGTLFSTGNKIEMVDEVAEWLRRWTANPMCSARGGSNPILVVIFFSYGCQIYSHAVKICHQLICHFWFSLCVCFKGSLKAAAHLLIFCRPTKNLHLSASVRWIQASLRQDRGFSGDIWQC